MNHAAKSSAWADPEQEVVRKLLRDSREIGWQQAVRDLRNRVSFFVERIENVALGNWQVLLVPFGSPSVLDIGSGFGSITLGSSTFAGSAVGIDVLKERLSFGALRVNQSDVDNVNFVRADGFAAPFQSGTFDAITLNGVLEWAGLYTKGDPVSRQIELLEEASRLVSTEGSVCVAIENSWAAETLLGMRDTHTGTHFLTALPEPLSSICIRLRKGEDPRVRLHSPRGYKKLFERSGFSNIRQFNLIPSYNNYRFVIEADDVASHRFVYENFDTGEFYEPAARLRRKLVRTFPAVLSSLAYAYLIVGRDEDRPTLLDAGTSVWESLQLPVNLDAFAVQMETPGALGIMTHTAGRAHSFVKTWPRKTSEPPIPPELEDGFDFGFDEGPRREVDGRLFVGYRCM